MLIQQGDVLFQSLGAVPDGAARIGDVVAEGEATGHAHRVTGAGAAVLEAEGHRYVSAPAGATVVHEEHAPVTLPPGVWDVRKVREYDHFAEEAREVVD